MDKLVSDLMGGLGRLFGRKVTDAVSKTVSKAVSGKSKTYTFESLPQTVDELKALPEAALTDVYAVAALSLLALTRFETDKEESIKMLNFLKGPDQLTPMALQQISDRFMDGKFYKVNSFFEGATPANNYTPSTPYKIKVSSTPYSFDNENWAVLYLHSGGADNPRPVKLRKKPSTGQWFIVEIQYLSDVRTPVAADKWA
ncbi:MAG: hypothetical protein J6N54_03460 [Bacteroidales bacterium]|nr:hypothetical protein [Bacteroidales bacterium]